MATLKELFSATCRPVITRQVLAELSKFTAMYEVRDKNPMALNTPMLGVVKSYWYPKDADAIFNMFSVDKREFMQCIKASSAVDKNFNVTSNEFNLLVIWLIYHLHNEGVIKTMTKQLCYQASLDLLKLLNYKFFSGKVAMQFPYGAKESVMQYTIDNLTAKSDIKNSETDTWKKLIYKHATVALIPNSIYANVFKNFGPDAAIVKSISDIHTRLCRKIVLISEAYYENNAKGNAYGTTSLVTEDEEKGKVLGNLQGTIDVMISRITTAILNTNEFIDTKHVQLASKLAANTRADMINSMLISFSAMATQQVKDKTTYEVTQDKKKNTLYIGYAKLIEELIQKIYRRAAITGVDLKNNLAILQLAKNTFTASRVIDVDILKIKDSVDNFVTTHTKYTRTGTLVGLRLGFILYIILISFKYR